MNSDDLTVDCDGIPAGEVPSGVELPDRFRLLHLIGSGGMGEVYAAEDLTLGRRVALKAIRSQQRLAPAARERFLREARLLSRLDHPGICRIFDLVETAGRDYLVLELIEGRTLSRAATDLSDRQRLEVALQIAAVLEAAHAEDIVHRDLKPDNIMLTGGGQTKVLDFGLARDLAVAAPSGEASETGGVSADPDATVDAPEGLTRLGVVMGTPAYLSPEQARGEPASPASDMFGFGLVLQKLFTGESPYDRGGDIHDLIARARRADTRPVTGIDRDLAALIEGLKNRSPASRPTAVEVGRRLAWIQGKSARRIRRWMVAAAVVLMMAAGAKYTLDLRRERGIAQRHRAEAEGLIEFMLGDLRERLEPVGRLDVLDEVGDRALTYFAARSEDDLSPADHHRFARAMNQIGEVRLNQGDLDAAREAFTKARGTAAELAARDPGRGTWLLTLGASEFWLGNVAYLEGDLEGAERDFLAYAEVADRLVALDPENEDWQREVGYAQTNLAALHEARGKTDEALAALDESIRIKRLLVDSAPGDAGRRRDLINALSWQGNVLVGAGDPRTALERFSAGVAETESLITADPGDMAHREKLAVLLHSTAGTAEWLGEDDRAAELYAASLRESRRLVDHDPTNAVWVEGLATTENAIARRHLWQGRPGSAADHFARARDLGDGLIAIKPDNLDYLAIRVLVLRGQAGVAAARGDFARARGHAEGAIETARRAHDLGEGNRTSTVSLAACLVQAGEIAMDSGDPGRAAVAWNEAHDLMAPLAGSRDRLVRDVWMRVLTHSGDLDGARRVVAGLRADGFVGRDLRAFQAKHGLKDPVADASG